MANISKQELLNRIISAINDSGWNILYISDQHPFVLQIYKDVVSYRVRIYIWNITHGGGSARPSNEYRIQVTGLDTDHFIQLPGEKTLILGWREELGVFGGFDFRKHTDRLGFSPSLQIREESLEQAVQTGFAPCDKGNQEIAIAFRPDFFVDYVRNLEQLHDFGESTNDLAILEEVSNNPNLSVNDEDLEIQDINRRTVVVQVNLRVRSANFRRKVLSAYNNRCAFCGIQLRLVDAAHIIPVNHENSVDEIYNGLALCVLHHRAFDQALVTVIEDYHVVINNDIVAILTQSRLSGGITEFSQNLLDRIITPIAQEHRPHIELIRMANRIRGWKAEQVQPSTQ